ncbi:hypothetical protein [Paraburkholderia humisilvae]|uniref:Uncharacterized protein n=1 Tax=Paraburkholderia humisilvae TaxID=627669 RepID=A0A6J5F1U3_9BURK|nr:hypothetical protein [Paraburkholderia humisilvae]CAB3772324.1 hypothetical protein LMG29542_06853 [Paraburkholderia humisilvae]
MPKTVLTAEQIRQEVHQRILQGQPGARDQVGISVRLPRAHPVDADERNWDMDEPGHPGYDAYVGRVIEEARREFFLSDAAERDETIGDSFAHS